MTRKLISVALALCMFATALVALNVAGDELSGTLKTKDAAGEDQTLYFGYDIIHFQLTFDVDEEPAEAFFEVQLTDLSGSTYDTMYIWTNEYGVYNSWEAPNEGLDHPGDPDLDAGKYLVEAALYYSGKTLFTKQITVINAGIEFEPDRTVFAPGENVTMTITLDYDDDVNITIWPVNVSWNNMELDDYVVEVTWEIPDDIETGAQTIYVNESVDDSPINWWWITISYFTFSMNADREITPGVLWGTYMPGETVYVEFQAYGVPDKNRIYADLIEFNMTYLNSVTGDLEWLNLTFEDEFANATWFEFEIPDLARIHVVGNDIIADVEVYVGDYSISDTIGIELDTLTATITEVNPTTVAPGASTLVRVLADADGSPVPDASVTLMLEDGEGNIVGTPMNNLTTNIMGEASAQITVPATVEPGTWLKVVAEIDKLQQKDKDSWSIWISSLWTIDVYTDKSEYLGGETIMVEVEIKENGVTQEPDYLEYWVVSTTDVYLSHIWTATDTSLEVIAPEDVDAEAQIAVVAYLDDGEVVLSQSSNEFMITTLILTVSASKLQYLPGDTIKFEVYADAAEGMLGQFVFWYSIWDNDGVAIADGESLTLNDDGRESFELEVPEDEPSTSYDLQVVADNGMGIVKVVELTLELLYDDYMIHVWIKTAPEYYQMNAYAPGQTITVAFEIVPQRDSVPDLPYVSVNVEFDGRAIGEQKTFTEMSGEVKVTIPENTATGSYQVTVNIVQLATSGSENLWVSANSSNWDKTLGGLNASSWLMIALMIIVIIMLLLMMMRSWGGAATGMAKAEKPPAEPKKEEAPKEYQPKASVPCPNCGAAIEIGTSKRPIEVMCPKCGTSQMVQ